MAVGATDPASALHEAAAHLFTITPELTRFHYALVLVPGFIVIFGLFSGFIKERLYVGEAIIATVFGIIYSEYAAGIFDPRSWAGEEHINEFTLEFTRVVIALSVFAVGVELPKAYVVRHWRSLAALLGPVMVVGWLVSGGLITLIIPGLSFLPALVVAAGLSPTDPILASSVVGKGRFAQEHVPAHIRHILQAESGSNDGAAFPFLYLALFLLLREDRSVGVTIGYWILLVLLYQIVLGVVFGAAVGIAARKLLKYSKRRKLIDRESMVAMYVGLALLVTGLTTLVASDDLLSAFACGVAFAWDDFFTESIEDSNFSSTIDLLSNCTIFIYLGATMPIAAWSDAALTLTPWRLVVLAISLLFLRRIPAIFLMQRLIPDIKTNREAIFCGHFGPMGVGAIFISTLAASKLPPPTVPPETPLDILALSIQPITYFIVLSSILVHGLTIGFFSLGRRVHSRVQSISRTFTQASMGGDEPSWMSRVKRVAAGEDIVINRDDDSDEKIDLEKGDEARDTGRLAMFAVPTSSSKTASTSTEGKDEKGSTDGKDEKGSTDRNEKGGKDEGVKRTERQMESDDHPPLNILSEDPREHDSHEDGIKRKDTHYSAPHIDLLGNEDDHHVIVNHEDDTGDVHIHDLNPAPHAIQQAKADPGKSLLALSRSEIAAEREENEHPTNESAVKKIAGRMIRKATLVSKAVLPKDDGLTPEEREARRRDKWERDAWCRKEQHFSDREVVPPPRAPRRPATAVARQWMEGNKVVVETNDGETVEVRKLTSDEEKDRDEHRVSLDGIRSELGELASAATHEIDHLRHHDKGKGPAASPSPAGSPKAPAADRGLGLTLTRTIRVGEDPEDAEWEDDAAETPDDPAAVAHRTTPPPVRPSVRRSGSTIKSMRQMLFHRNRSPDTHPTSSADRGRQDGHQTKESSRSTSPTRSISFAAHSRPKHSPARPPGIIAKHIPAKLGGAKNDLRMSRTSTSGSIRFVD